MKTISSIIANKEIYNSYCDRTIMGVIKLRLKCFLLWLITFGFAYPWIVCKLEDARCSRTVVCGKRLKFIGNPNELITHWIYWWFLTVITFGIYGMVVKIRFEQWVTANTVFEDTVLVESCPN